MNCNLKLAMAGIGLVGVLALDPLAAAMKPGIISTGSGTPCVFRAKMEVVVLHSTIFPNQTVPEHCSARFSAMTMLAKIPG